MGKALCVLSFRLSFVDYIKEEYPSGLSLHNRRWLGPTFEAVGDSQLLPIGAVCFFNVDIVRPGYSVIGAAFQHQMMRCLICRTANARFGKREQGAVGSLGKSV